VALDVDIVAMQKVIEVFTAHRLLSLDRDQVSGSPTVEVAHEALLTEWEQLRLWIEDNREDLVRYRELAIASGIWHEAGRDEDYVYAGGRLDEALAWAATSAIKLTRREQDFLDAGAARLAAERAAAEESVRREQQLQRSARRRTWGLASAITVLVAVVATVLFVVTRPEGPKVALVQWSPIAGSGQDLIEQGWLKADRELDIAGERVVSLVDDEAELRALADDGYELIISGTFDNGRSVHAVAADYPEVSFVVFDAYDDSFDNLTSLEFVREGGAYLIGAAAALQSETGKIGFIGGWQQASTESRRASFAAGARSVNPDIVVDSVYLGPYYHQSNGGYSTTTPARRPRSRCIDQGLTSSTTPPGSPAQGFPPRRPS
jgi:hypothetical protein